MGLLATRLGVPVIPVQIDGLYELRAAGRRTARPRQVKVTIGAPMKVELDADPAWVSRDLEQRIRDLDPDVSSRLKLEKA